MTAVAILIIAAILAWLWSRVLNRATGEQMMALGPILLAPFVAIALIFWS